MNTITIHTSSVFEQMVECARNAMIITTPGGIITFANNRANTFFLYDKNALKGTSIDTLIAPGSIDQFVPFRDSDLISSIPVVSQFRAIRRDGTDFPVEVYLTTIQDEEEQYLFFTIIDQTERKLFEQQQTLFSSIVDCSDDAIFSKDLNGIITSWNPAAEKTFGYTAAEIVGRSITTLIPSHLLDDETLIIRKIKKGESVNHYETQRIRKDGNLIHVSLTVSPIRNAQGQIIGASKILRDITAQKRAEEEISNSEIRFRRTMDQMMEGVRIYDNDWRCIYANDSAVRQGSYAKEELYQRTLQENYPGVEQTPLFRIFQECKATGESRHIEYNFALPDGTSRWYELSLLPNPTDLFILSIDIDGRKNAEKNIKTAYESLEKKIEERTAQLQAANKELESFSYSVAHDLRAPLRGMYGYATILKEDYGPSLDQEGQRVLRAIEANAKKMGLLIDDLLTFSRLNRKEMNTSAIDMADLFATSLADVCRSQPNTAEVSMAALHTAHGDTALIRHVITNLLSNAVKYSSKSEKPHIDIYSTLDDDRVTYTVSDNGVGFDMEYVDKLFGVFQRLHSDSEFEGTGVGLAIAEHIIRRHHGEIWAQSTEGHGATFQFTLPHAIPKSK